MKQTFEIRTNLIAINKISMKNIQQRCGKYNSNKNCFLFVQSIL